MEPRCTYYRRDADGAYPRSWYYLMHKLDEKLSRYFLCVTGDLGFGGSNDEKDLFLERFPKLERFFKPKYHT